MPKNVDTVIAPPLTLRSRLQIGFTWNLVGALFNQGSTFAVNVVVANILGRHGFGEFAMIQSTIVTLSMISQMAMGFTAAKHVAEFRSVDKEKTGRILGLCTIVSTVQAVVASLALLVAAPWVAGSVLKEPLLSSELMIASAAVLFTAMNSYQTGALSGLESYRPLGLAGAISGVLYFGICSGAVWFWGLQGVLAGLAASTVIQWGILHTFFRAERLAQGIAIHYRNLWNERAALFGFALPAAISGFSSMPALWLANAFLVNQVGGYSQMALYAAANNLRLMVLFMPVVLNTVCASLLNNQMGLSDNRGYRRLFWTNVVISGSSVLLGAISVSLFGKQLLGVFGKNFAEGYGVLCILMISTIPEGLTHAFFQIIQSKGRMWLNLFIIALPRDLTIIALSYYFSPLYGAKGLACAYTIAWVLTVVSVTSVACSIGLSSRSLLPNP